jgi:ATP-dependent RNA helicase DDX24/MAK5
MSKKQKTRHVALDDLSWQPVVRTHAAGLDFDEGLLGLEEVVGVQVAYQQTANGRVAAFVVRFLSQIRSWVMFLIQLRWMIRKTHQ